MHPFWGVKTAAFYHAGDVPEFGIAKNSGRHLAHLPRRIVANPMIPILIWGAPMPISLD
jgi:hypothetical protein